MERLLFTVLLLFISVNSIISQNSEVSVDSLLTEKIVSDTLVEEESEPLLPTKYIFTQRLLWSENGLMRNFNHFNLTEEGRDRELAIRNTMLTAHRYLGYATLAGMIAQGIVGQRLSTGEYGLKGLHEGLAGAVNIGYFTTAGLSLFAPPRMRNRSAGLSTVKVHKYLSIIHLSSMVATNVLSGMIEKNPSLMPYHKAAAFTAFGSYFASLVIIHF